MATVPQLYGEPGAPLDVDIDPRSVAPVWFAHRARLTDWLAALDDRAWDGPTRCTEWTVAGLVRHLASVSAFEGFTLHQAAKGEPTRLLEGFDSQVLPGAAAAALEGRSPTDLLATLRADDARIEETVAAWTGDDWTRTAEAPPGHVPAWLSLAHMLFDSWVHEHDLLRPRELTPPLVPAEVEIVVPYVLALAGFVAGVADGTGVAADIRVIDTGLQVGLDTTGGRSVVRLHEAPAGAPVVEGTAVAILDVATGRVASTDDLDGEPEAVAVLTTFARMLA